MKAFSQNGYLANQVSLTKVYTIAGTTRKIRLHSGAPGALLVHFLAWFDAHIEPLDVGQLDDWGFAVRPIRGQEVQYDKDGNAINLSNHSSGTAGDANATKHPLAKRNTFTRAKMAAIRKELARPEYGGCIRWGGDYVKRADEMHFEIVKGTAACEAALKKLTATTPPVGDDDVALTEADLAKVEERSYKGAMRANREYGIALWVTDGGTGKEHVIDVLADHTLRLKRIEADTDDANPSSQADA